MADDAPLLEPAHASIGRWTLDRYLIEFRWWMLGGAAVAIGLTILSVPRIGVVGAEILFFLLLGNYGVRVQAGRTEAMTAGAVGGAVIGGGSGLAHFIMLPTFYAALNIVSEVLITAAVGTLLTVSALLLTKQFIHQHTP